MDQSELMRRRMKMIAAHFAPCEDLSPSHLLPMNCSSSLNSVIRRCDNKMYFARQGSTSQAFFMRQSSTEQLGSSEKHGMPLKCPAFANELWSCNGASQAPLFARPTQMEPNFSNIEAIQPPAKDCKSPVLDLPSFARPNQQISRKEEFHSRKQICSSESNGIEWSPRMDVEESGRNYILTVEAPGVNVNDIRVEINDQNLTIMGKRSTKCWRLIAGSNDTISRYHRREILQGPYQIVWRLPNGVNKDNVSAEFLEGLLQIIIPKL